MYICVSLQRYTYIERCLCLYMCRGREREREKTHTHSLYTDFFRALMMYMFLRSLYVCMYLQCAQLRHGRGTQRRNILTACGAAAQHSRGEGGGCAEKKDPGGGFFYLILWEPSCW